MSCLLTLALPLFAQTSSSNTDGEQLPVEPNVEEAEQPPIKKAPEKKAEVKKAEPIGKARPKDTVFKPSEEISEDRPVPFPVDI